ncbi:MAG: hypothetical protein Q4A15_02420 [Prevotellaceae bacterium]|nr:hypothetical protein [Prevotellaceae bacterium]
MKPIVYFFGTLPNGFSSYPQDHTKKIFEGFVSKSKNISQIVLHRKDNLLYYGYVRKMSKDKYFGICICVDCIYNDINYLFEVFDDIYALMIKKGDILKIGSNRVVEWATPNFVLEIVAITEYTRQIVNMLDVSERNTQPLPPINFSISINDCLSLSIEDSQDEIIDATKRYTNLYIVKKETEIERVNSFHATIQRKDNEIRDLKSAIKYKEKENTDLNNKLIRTKAKQRNITWVALLGVIIFILGFVLWNKVLFPSEVTHYETGEFVYYGPIKDNKPHGVGVAIYPSNDKDGRKYYIGNFVKGERQDNAAILFYQDGDYYYGSMKGDKWDNGILYMNSDKSHFEGSFNENNPYNGTWYDHIKLYKLVDGEKSYQ